MTLVAEIKIILMRSSAPREITKDTNQALADVVHVALVEKDVSRNFQIEKDQGTTPKIREIEIAFTRTKEEKTSLQVKT